MLIIISFCSQVHNVFEMTRRKSVCLKWTLAILVVISCPYVHTRPQDTSASSVVTEITTENLIRYRYKNYNLRLPIAISSVKKFSSTNETINLNISRPSVSYRLHESNVSNSNSNRTSRLIKNAVIRDMSKKKNKPERRPKPTPPILTNKIKVPHISNDRPRPAIKKVFTKWKDETKFEDLNFTYETTTSDETAPTTLDNFGQNNEYTSTESTKDEPVAKKRYPANYFTAVYKPQNEFSEETHVYSTNVQFIDKHPLQSTYMYTKRPSPTPEITNVGYPKPWQNQNPQTHWKPTTRKPEQITRPSNYNYHNNLPSYGNDYEVSTFQPASAYTERIVIRPEEYSGSNYDCPTIYLTLNNTFQGQAKEACPDLNIAVNTNVVNKNQVIETEEEDDGDSLFPNAFGIPVEEDSESEEFAANDFFGSTENQAQGESASVESTELSNYNAANAVQSESAEPGSLFSPSSPISAFSKPGRPDKDDDDIFSFTSLVQFFRPVISTLGWLASVNPFTIGLFPLFLAPIAFLFAGSGLAALFTPWFLPLGREAPKVIHVYRPYWHWDDTIKTWHLHSFPANRRWKPFSRSSKEEEGGTTKVGPLVQKLKNWMISITEAIKERVQNKTVPSKDIRKNKRKKRETWSFRVK